MSSQSKSEKPARRSSSCSVIFPGAYQVSSGSQGPDELCPHRAQYVCSSGPDCSIAYGTLQEVPLCEEHAVTCPNCGRTWCEVCYEDHKLECVPVYTGELIAGLIEMAERVAQ